MGVSEGAQGTLGVQGFAWSDTRSVDLTEVVSLSLSPLALLPIKRASVPGYVEPIPIMVKSGLRHLMQRVPSYF